MGYSFRLIARVLLYAPSHRQDCTYHSLCYTSRGALAGTRNSSIGPPHEGSIRRPTALWANALTTELHLAHFFDRGSKGTNRYFHTVNDTQKGTLLLNCVAPRQQCTILSSNSMLMAHFKGEGHKLHFYDKHRNSKINTSYHKIICVVFHPNIREPSQISGK